MGAPIASTVESTYNASAASPAMTPVTPTEKENEQVKSAEQAEKEGGDTFIAISVSDPQKIGDGMSAYMSYKITTNTNIPFFRYVK